MDIQTPPELPQRDVLRQQPHYNPHSVFFQYQFYVFFYSFYLLYFLQYFVKSQCFIFCFVADLENPFLLAVGRKLGLFSPTHTHYFLRLRYLSVAILRPFDRALLLISVDIEETSALCLFTDVKKSSTTLFPFASTSSESYHSMDEIVNTTFQFA